MTGPAVALTNDNRQIKINDYCLTFVFFNWLCNLVDISVENIVVCAWLGKGVVTQRRGVITSQKRLGSTVLEVVLYQPLVCTVPDDGQFVWRLVLSAAQPLLGVSAQPGDNRRGDPAPRRRPILLRRRSRRIVWGFTERRQRRRRSFDDDADGFFRQRDRHQPIHADSRHARGPFDSPPRLSAPADVHRCRRLLTLGCCCTVFFWSRICCAKCTASVIWDCYVIGLRGEARWWPVIGGVARKFFRGEK